VRVLAIDPGSMLGWATDATGRLEWGAEDFHMKRGEDSGGRWRRFVDWLNNATLMRSLVRSIADDPRRLESKVDLIVYEVAHFMPKARYAAEVAAGFVAHLEAHCSERKIALAPVHVQTLKAFALPKVKRKKGDPKMDRSKAAMIAAAAARIVGVESTCVLNRDEYRKLQDTGLHALSEHEADALWLYWWARENCK
jgi:hypothetical protein